MKRLEVSGAVRPLYGSLGFKGLNYKENGLACGKRVMNIRLQTENLQVMETWDGYIIGMNDNIKMDLTTIK